MLDRGDKHFDEKAFQQALKSYQEAQTIFPENAVIKQKIKSVEQQLQLVREAELAAAREAEIKNKAEAFILSGNEAMLIADYEGAIKKYEQALSVDENNVLAKQKLAEARDKNKEWLAQKSQQEKEAARLKREQEALKEKELAEQARKLVADEKLKEETKAKNTMLSSNTTDEEVRALMEELLKKEEQEKYAIIKRQKEMLENFNNAKAQLDNDELARIAEELEALKAAEKAFLTRAPISYQAVMELKQELDETNRVWKNLSDEEREKLKAEIDAQRVAKIEDPGQQQENVLQSEQVKKAYQTQYRTYSDRADNERQANLEDLKRRKEYVAMLYIEFKAKKSYVDELSFYKAMLAESEKETLNRFTNYQSEIQRRVDSLKSLRLNEDRLYTNQEENVVLSQTLKESVEEFAKFRSEDQRNKALEYRAYLEEFDSQRTEDLLIRDSQRQGKAEMLQEQKAEIKAVEKNKKEAQANQLKQNKSDLAAFKEQSDQKIQSKKDLYVEKQQLVEQDREKAKAFHENQSKQQVALIDAAQDSINEQRSAFSSLNKEKEHINKFYVDSISSAKLELAQKEEARQETFGEQLKLNREQVNTIKTTKNVLPDTTEISKKKKAVEEFNASQKAKEESLRGSNKEKIEQLKTGDGEKEIGAKTVTEDKIIEGNKIVIVRTVTQGDQVDTYKMVVAKWGTFYFKNGKSISQLTWERETEENS